MDGANEGTWLMRTVTEKGYRYLG